METITEILIEVEKILGMTICELEISVVTGVEQDNTASNQEGKAEGQREVNVKIRIRVQV